MTRARSLSEAQSSSQELKAAKAARCSISDVHRDPGFRPLLLIARFTGSEAPHTTQFALSRGIHRLEQRSQGRVEARSAS